MKTCTRQQPFQSLTLGAKSLDVTDAGCLSGVRCFRAQTENMNRCCFRSSLVPRSVGDEWRKAVTSKAEIDAGENSKPERLPPRLPANVGNNITYTRIDTS